MAHVSRTYASASCYSVSLTGLRQPARNRHDRWDPCQPPLSVETVLCHFGPVLGGAAALRCLNRATSRLPGSGLICGALVRYAGKTPGEERHALVLQAPTRAVQNHPRVRGADTCWPAMLLVRASVFIRCRF